MVSREELRKKYKIKILLRGGTGTGKCCKGDTLILTDKGLIKIEDIVRGHTDVSNKDRSRVVDISQSDLLEHFGEYVEDGEEFVYSDNVKNIKEIVSLSPKLEYKQYKISAKYDMGENNIITTKTSLGFEISGTPEHKVIIINKDGNLVFKKLENIKIGDNIAIAYDMNIFNDMLRLNFKSRNIRNILNAQILKNIDYMNENIAELLGYIISEGTCGFNKEEEPFYIIITSYDKEMVDSVHKICENIDLKYEDQYIEDKLVGVKINSVMLEDFIYYLGYRHGAKNKEIPWSILQADMRSQIAFLRALFDGDSTVGIDDDKNYIEYSSSSYELIRQLQLMLLNIGIISRAGIKKEATIKYKEEFRTYEKSYRLAIYGENILKFADIISFGLRRKKDILDECVDILEKTSRWTDITFPNIEKKLGILYDKLKFLGKSYGLYIKEGDRIKYVSAKAYLQHHNFECIWAYINGERQPSRLTLKKLLDILSPTKDMHEYTYLQSLSDMFIFDTIEDIKEGRERVYDVTIDGVHSYIGNGYINHNTYTAVKMAEYVASKGWKVLYLDHERGSSEELDKLDDKVIQNIIHEDFRNYKQIMDAIKKHREEQKDRLKLIIIDPMYLIEMSRLSARDAFLEQGYYYLGEKKVDIDNKETFDLRGFMYQLATTYQMKLLDEIVSCEQDIVVTLMTPNKHETEYDGKFSIVLETYGAWVGNQIFYKAIPKKFRGVDLNAMPAIDNPYKKLLEGFAKKYDAIGPFNDSKIEIKVDNKESNKRESDKESEIPNATT